MSNMRLETAGTKSAERMLKHSKFSPKYSQSHADKNMNSATSRAEVEREKRQSNYQGKKVNESE